MIRKLVLSKGQSLYVRILTAFIGLISLTVLPIIIYGYYVDSKIMLSMADNLIIQVTRTAIDKTTDYLMPLSRIVDLSSKIANVGALSLKNDTKLEGYTIEVLKSYSQTSMFYLGDENGNFVMARRQSDGTISTDIINHNTSPPTEIWKYDYCLCSELYGIISLNNWLNGAWQCNKQHSA